MSVPAKYDAVLFPTGYASKRSPGKPAQTIKDEFQELLGGGPIDVRDVGGQWLVTQQVPTKDHTDVFSHHTLNYPYDHPAAGQCRYLWTNRGDGKDGVKFGTLKPDDEVLVEEANVTA